MKITFTEQTKKIIKEKMLEQNTSDINDVINNFITQEAVYKKRIELLQGALEKFKDIEKTIEEWKS